MNTTDKKHTLSPGNVKKKRARTKKSLLEQKLAMMNPNAAGIDIASREHWVCVPEDRAEPNVRQFGTFTCDLYAIAAWLKDCDITSVAMESTGVYWIPLFQVLEQQGLEVCLVNAKHLKNVASSPTPDPLRQPFDLAQDRTQDRLSQEGNGAKKKALDELSRRPESSPTVSPARKPDSRTPKAGMGVSWQAEYARLSEMLQGRQYDPKTVNAYTKWVRTFQAFTRSKPPDLLSSDDARAFLTSLTKKRTMTVSKQNQVYDALLLLYRQVLNQTFDVDRPSHSPASDFSGKKMGSSHQAVAAGAHAGRGASWEAEYAKLTSEIKTRHYSPGTLKTYRGWVRRFQAFTKSKAPNTLTVEDVKAYLSYLAMEREVSASTQNQAFNALLFFFRHGLGKEFGEIDGVVRAKRKPYIPVVLSREEIDTILQHLEPPYNLVVKLLYGCGLRVSECLNLRVNCFNFDAGVLTVHDGKGQKDRTVPLPETILPELQAQLESLKVLHQHDLDKNYAGVFLVHALERKYKHAAKEFIWQWFFPAKELTYLEDTREYRRYHLHKTHVQKAIKQAVRKTKICKRATAHTFRPFDKLRTGTALPVTTSPLPPPKGELR